jgi:hypothetical protein
MERGEKRVDGFRFLPPGLRAWIQSFIPPGDFTGPIPWTPLAKPLRQATMGLVTSAGISLKTDPPFDMEREKREPTWGDRSFREIPRHARPPRPRPDDPAVAPAVGGRGNPVRPRQSRSI